MTKHKQTYNITLYDPDTGVETHKNVTAKWIRKNVADPSVFLGKDWEKGK